MSPVTVPRLNPSSRLEVHAIAARLFVFDKVKVISGKTEGL